MEILDSHLQCSESYRTFPNGTHYALWQVDIRFAKQEQWSPLSVSGFNDNKAKMHMLKIITSSLQCVQYSMVAVSLHHIHVVVSEKYRHDSRMTALILFRKR